MTTGHSETTVVAGVTTPNAPNMTTGLQINATIQIYPCSGNPCGFGKGNCTVTNDTYTCSCFSSFTLNSTGSHTCIDKHPCDRNMNPCGNNANKNEGTQGCIKGKDNAYTCSCKPDFQQGIDENNVKTCLEKHPCDKAQNPCGENGDPDKGNKGCIKNNGTVAYTCKCKTDFFEKVINPKNETTCQEKHPCDKAISPCGKGGVNNDGCKKEGESYSCICKTDYESGTTSDGKVTCTALISPCEATPGICEKSGKCVPVPSDKSSLRYRCDCPKFYKANDLKSKCIDIDECNDKGGKNICYREGTPNAMQSYKSTCVNYEKSSNHPDGYACPCQERFSLEDSKSKRCLEPPASRFFAISGMTTLVGQRAGNITFTYKLRSCSKLLKEAFITRHYVMLATKKSPKIDENKLQKKPTKSEWSLDPPAWKRTSEEAILAAHWSGSQYDSVEYKLTSETADLDNVRLEEGKQISDTSLHIDPKEALFVDYKKTQSQTLKFQVRQILYTDFINTRMLTIYWSKGDSIIPEPDKTDKYLPLRVGILNKKCASGKDFSQWPGISGITLTQARRMGNDPMHYTQDRTFANTLELYNQSGRFYFDLAPFDKNAINPNLKCKAHFDATSAHAYPAGLDIKDKCLQTEKDINGTKWKNFKNLPFCKPSAKDIGYNCYAYFKSNTSNDQCIVLCCCYKDGAIAPGDMDKGANSVLVTSLGTDNKCNSTQLAGVRKEAEDAFKYCCKDDTDMCNSHYYERHPKTTANKDDGSAPSDSNGDPHFRLLDFGTQYTFNGVCEYLMTESKWDTLTFVLHTKTEALAKGSVFAGFAVLVEDTAGILNSAPLIFLKKNTSGILLIDVTSSSTPVTSFPLSGNNFELRDISTSDSISYEIKYDLGLLPDGITFSVMLDKFGTLSSNLIMPKELETKGTTRGLAGNFNGLKDDDFVSADGGTSYPADASESQLYQMGKTYAIPNDASRVFTDTYNCDPSFVPYYTDEPCPHETLALNSCNNDNTSACYIDVCITGNPDIGSGTAAAGNAFDELKAALDARPPNITSHEPGRVYFYGMADTTYTVKFEGSDYNGDTFFWSISDEPPGMTIHKDTGALSWAVPDIIRPEEAPTTEVTVRVTDTTERSTEIKVPIRYCRCKQGKGQCTFEEGIEPYKQLECKCDTIELDGVITPLYEGEDCGDDFNACFGGFCDIESSCTDTPAAQVSTLSKQYTCASCPQGMTGDPYVKCTDIDECTDDSPCDPNGGECQNIKKSFTCSCKKGLRVDPKNSLKCVDIDECTATSVEDKHKCVHATCKNKYRGYECICNDGYKLLDGTVEDYGDGVLVKTECINIDESLTGDHQCDLNTTRVVDVEPHQHSSQWKYECKCLPGKSATDSQFTCKEIDECLSDTMDCSQKCVDKTLGFGCACNSGYILRSDNKTCRAINECSAGDKLALCANGECKMGGNDNKTLECDCGTLNEYINTTCQDKNECAMGEHKCNLQTSICINTKGSAPGYMCNCTLGFAISGDGVTCVDSDECETSPCKANSVCKNNVGSFVCICDPGYTKDTNDPLACIDVDECAKDKGGCDPADKGICNNKNGTHECGCKTGYTLSGNFCEDIDECDSETPMCNTQTSYCENKQGGYDCACFEGYKFNISLNDCENINECQESEIPCVSRDSDGCKDTIGSYSCSCPFGYTLRSDGATCRPDSECVNDNCNHTCARVNGVNQCGCNNAFFKLAPDNETCIDVDECQDNGAIYCPDVNKVTCQNLDNGQGYQCNCKTPAAYYQTSKTQCKDIDECEPCRTGVGDCPCKSAYSTCVNMDFDSTGKKYECRCTANFESLETLLGICIDINECTTNITTKKHKCAHTCQNKNNGYDCGCHSGYKLADDAINCENIDECTEDSDNCDKSLRGRCLDTIGSFECHCAPGYTRLSNDSTSCVDVNECGTKEDNCVQDCKNEPGTFRCTCQEGFRLASDGFNCVLMSVCVSNPGCSDFCVNIGDVDTCKCNSSKYMLAADNKTCIDFPECTLPDPVTGNQHRCHGSYNCIEKTPGFSCLCTDGYIAHPNGLDCIDRHGGWSSWSAYGNCSVTCGGGTKQRTRICNNPTKVGNGNDCAGQGTETATCGESCCPLTKEDILGSIQIGVKSTCATTDKYINGFKSSWENRIVQEVNDNCTANPSLCCQSPFQPRSSISGPFCSSGDLSSVAVPCVLPSDTLRLVYRISINMTNSGFCQWIGTPQIGNETFILPGNLFEAIINPILPALTASAKGTCGDLGNSSVSIEIPTETVPTFPPTTVGTPEEKDRPKWVIAVAVVCGVIVVVVIVAVVVVLKMKSPKVIPAAKSA